MLGDSPNTNLVEIGRLLVGVYTMTITVKKLISELEKIENKYLEVEIEIYDKPTIMPSIKSISNMKTKIILRPVRTYDK